MLPLRLVIDTNVLISAAIKPTGLQRSVLLLAITKPARLYVSRHTLEDYGQLLARPELLIRKGVRQ
jgi:predicted nucleic acid-binding protein